MGLSGLDDRDTLDAVSDLAMPGHDGLWLIRRVRPLEAECDGHVPRARQCRPRIDRATIDRYSRSTMLLPELVELTGIEPVTS